MGSKKPKWGFKPFGEKTVKFGKAPIKTFKRFTRH